MFLRPVFLRLLFVASLMLPGTGWAHAILMESQPGAGATVAPSLVLVQFRFNSRIDHARSRLLLRSGPAVRALPLDPGSPPDTLASQAGMAPGEYTLRWQVLAIDGHITRGDIPFTVRAP